MAINFYVKDKSGKIYTASIALDANGFKNLYIDGLRANAPSKNNPDVFSDYLGKEYSCNTKSDFGIWKLYA